MYTECPLQSYSLPSILYFPSAGDTYVKYLMKSESTQDWCWRSVQPGGPYWGHTQDNDLTVKSMISIQMEFKGKKNSSKK